MIDLTTLRGAIEAILFISDSPLSNEKLSELTGQNKDLIDKILKELQNEYKEMDRGIQIREVGGGFRMMTHPAYAEYVEKLVISKDYRRLTQAALETLAIIAYKQPITRQEISNIRGVNAEAVIHSLIEKNIVEEKGRKQSPGLPILYGTTREFLESFNLNSLKDLPPLEEFEPDDETKEKIKLRLQDTTTVDIEEKERDSLADKPIMEDFSGEGKEETPPDL